MTTDTMNALIDDLLTTLRREGIDNALYEQFTLWPLLADLLTHAGIDRDHWHPAVKAANDLTAWASWPLPAA
jgi:hypothetical protein